MNRLKSLRLENNKLQSDIGKILGVSDRAVSNYENGKRDMSPETIIKLANYFNVSTDYFLGKTDIRKPMENINNSKKYYMCPVYGRISAGQPNWAEECIEGRLPIDIELMNIVEPEECFFLRVNGESMNKEIQNGAYALIRKTDSVDDGDIAVVLVNGYDATLKVFNRQGDFILLEPMSTDSSFKTQVYGKDTEIKIIGKYIGKMEMK
ncbi:MAG: XRE family transcriptional regulator [Clostridia bacterium]|nr:XRE family transcriptional regulator [Clostridia bacterium]